MLQALAETVKSATWRMIMPSATYSTTDVVPTILTILHRCYMSEKQGKMELNSVHSYMCACCCDPAYSVPVFTVQ